MTDTRKNPPIYHNQVYHSIPIKLDQKVNIFDACPCSTIQIGFDCGHCEKNVENTQDHMVNGKFLCKKD